MGGFAGPDIACAVSKAGGLGMIGALNNAKQTAEQLAKVEETMPRNGDVLEIGIGFLPFITKLEETLPVLEQFKPAVVWLFAAKENEDYATWSAEVRKVTPKTKIWIQLGSVSAALTVARLCKPDAIAVQGQDAGGHGFEKGAGIISLVPEIFDALQEAGFGGIPLIAGGGISDGRGAAAALTLGAQGVNLGTRFLAAQETALPLGYQAAVLAAKDGGQSTIRCKLFDELKGPNIWPGLYDGRGIIMESYTDYASGVAIDEIRKLHAEALKDEAGYGKTKRAAMWAGTGVGLVTKVQPAGDIIREVREGAIATLDRTHARL